MYKNIRIFATFILLFAALPTAMAKKETKKEIVKATISVQDQRKLDYYFFEAVKQRQLNNLDCAIDLLTECYYINPKNAAVLFEFAQIYTNIQDNQRALKFMSLASQEDRSNSWYKIGLAELCIKNNDLKNAILIYEDIAKNHSESEDVDYMLASLYKQTQQFKKSIDALNKVEEKNGINEIFSFEKYRLYTELNKKKKADAEIDKLIEKFPFEIRYRILRGTMYLDDNKQEKKALQQYNEAKKIEPTNSMLLMAMYNYYKAIKDTANAEAQFREAFLSKDISADEKIELLSQYLSIENQSVQNADENFKLMTNLYPKNETIHSYYASFLLMQRRYNEALPELQLLLELNPKNDQAWIELVQVYISLDKAEQAFTTIDSALIKLPEEASLYLMKGLFLFQKNKNEEALSLFKKGVLVIKPDQEKLKFDLYSQIGDIYAVDNKLDSAFIYYENAYQINDNNASLLNNYAYYLSVANKDLAKAELMSAKTVQAYPENISFLDTYAWIFFQQGNLTLAKMYLQQAIDKGGDKSEIIVEHFGDALFKNGEIEEAINWWIKSKELGNKSTILEQKIETKTYIPELIESK